MRLYKVVITSDVLFIVILLPCLLVKAWKSNKNQLQNVTKEVNIRQIDCDNIIFIWYGNFYVILQTGKGVIRKGEVTLHDSEVSFSEW